MLFCPKCGTRNKTTYNYCRKCGTKIKYSIDNIKPATKELTEYKINEFITLKLEKGKTVIYVKDEKFLQCKYLLIEIPKDNLKDFDDFMSIDDVSEKLDHTLERNMNYIQIAPEIEFWGHCSNLQAWSENFYDTSLLHSNLAFPLLKKLADVGDPKARRVFKDEIVEKLMNIHTNVAQYLIRENYLEYFDNEENELLMEILFEQIEKKLKKKQSFILEDTEIEALLDIIKVNINKSKTFLVNQLKSVEKINKKTHIGFSYENNRIITLGFNRCGLEILPTSIGDFENLEELYMTENRLIYLPKSLGNLKNLNILNLNDNNIIELPEEIGNLINLKELHINHNIIQILPDSISKLKSLEIFSIWGNQLRFLPQNINEMDSLRVLGLSFNQLEDFPNLMSVFPNLEILDLSNNKIKKIPENIKYLESLKILWLNNNPIKTIPESLLDLQSLTDLYMINTPIEIEKDRELKKILIYLEGNGINIWK
ncbi:MAG: leucine-rich repeat domain-containing protein [Candidatus Lokiarchaeota archaeon]|nr:leucine-rich repeat domain-containing protein [Candidatus Lokiarchaeota archaeon]